MIAVEALQRWRSTQANGLEVTEVAISAGEHVQAGLEDARERMRGDERFLILRPDRLTTGTFLSCVDAVLRAALDVRVCLVVPPGVLPPHSDPSWLDRVAFMLDVSRADLPWSEMPRDGFEAVRFGPDFTRRTMGTMRGICMLDAMLGLARDLGLTTFGPDVRSGDPCERELPPFDYVPAERIK